MAMSFMWLLLTVTVTCLCASPRCKSSATSLSFSAYCQKLCMWGRGGNLCHCNAMHFVGKRRDVRQQQLGEDGELRMVRGPPRDVDEQPWNDDEDDDLLTASNDWLDDEENSTSADEQSDTAGSSVWTRDGRRRRRQPTLLLALRRLDRRHADVEDADQLLRDSAKKGERREPLVDDEPSDVSAEDGRDVMTLNTLTRKPMTFRVPANTQHGDAVRKMTSQSRLPTRNLDAIYRMTR